VEVLVYYYYLLLAIEKAFGHEMMMTLSEEPS
jgi:hypothetical protein